MELERFDSAQAFERAAGGWLARDERAHNLVLSVLRRALHDGGPAHGWVVTGNGEIQLAGFQTPPHRLLLSLGSPDAARWAAAALPAAPGGVAGPGPVADAFTTAWQERTGCLAEVHSEMTFYTLERVEPFARPPGAFRRATEAESGALLPLSVTAARDMRLPAYEQEPEYVKTRLRQALAAGHQFVWDDSGIRAIARAVCEQGRAGARIGYVFTPAEWRNRGYGTAVTGSLARLLLDEGTGWVVLFADNANAVSTGIYRRLGFAPLAVFRTWNFEAAR